LATGLGLGGRVHWVGHVPYSAVGEYLDAADVLVLPTWEDTWGMTVPEALLAGKPVLCSVRAGSSELVEDGRNGYLFDPLDPTMLAERMRRFVEHPERSEEMGRRGRQVIAEHTPKAAGDFLVTVAQKVLQRSALQ
jgi:glycosyltransferase involved in cell wall biosynthesis